MNLSMMKRPALHVAAAAFAALAVFSPAQAHIQLEYAVAPAGSSYKASFKVGHGCAGAPTRQISVRIPDGVRGARPMPKPGWSLAIERQKLAVPYTSDGRTVSEDVVRITWTVNSPENALANDLYDEFVLVGNLPEKPDRLYWPVSQVCEPGRIEWSDIPQPGQKPSDLKRPAPSLELMPSSGGNHHH